MNRYQVTRPLRKADGRGFWGFGHLFDTEHAGIPRWMLGASCE